ncbi:MAG: hypothetical protein KDC00_03550, partial [Flavobacteriales bacterium]|nr:hypothetical protein [Flavobacteriales bacterium]
MRTITALLLMFSCACTVSAQLGWQQLYRAGTSYTFDLIELPGQHIFTTMGATQLLDAQGSIQRASYFHDGGTYGLQTLKRIGPNELLFNTAMDLGSCPWGNASLRLPVLGKIDTLGHTLLIRKYEMNNGICSGLPGRLEVTGEKGGITWGREKNFFAIRVDSMLEPVWTRHVERSGGFQFIKELPNGDLLAGINMDTAGAVVARMDAEGNFLWSKSYMRPKGMVHDALIEPDGSFIITGYTDSIRSATFPASFHPKLFMMKLDGDGEVQWCKGWYSSPYQWYTYQPSSIRRTLDGQYAVLATTGVPQSTHYYHPFLMKTDTNGDTLWTRAVGSSAYTYLPQDLLAHSDGGYMLSGVIYGEFPESASLKFIYKTDSLGRFNCLEHTNPVEEMDLFPVDSSFTLTSVSSETTATTILVNDSILDPSIFTEYDGCTVATLLDPFKPRRQFRIRPNPTTGRFTVEFP